jgi:hypothetical protein
MTQLHRVFCLVGFAAALLLLPLRAAAQSGTLTDDGFVSTNPTAQLLNLNGQGQVLIVRRAQLEFEKRPASSHLRPADR